LNNNTIDLKQFKIEHFLKHQYLYKDFLVSTFVASKTEVKQHLIEVK